MGKFSGKPTRKEIGRDIARILDQRQYPTIQRTETPEELKQKRKDSASLKEKLEAANVEISMPAGNNGKLYGAVTTNVIADALAKLGFEVERKRIDLAGIAIKTVGNYKATVKLYEAQTAEVKIAVVAQDSENKAEAKKEKKAETTEEKAE